MGKIQGGVGQAQTIRELSSKTFPIVMQSRSVHASNKRREGNFQEFLGLSEKYSYLNFRKSGKIKWLYFFDMKFIIFTDILFVSYA